MHSVPDYDKIESKNCAGTDYCRERTDTMKKQNRIALFIGQADEEYQSRFITGFLKKTVADGFDVCVFSMYR